MQVSVRRRAVAVLAVLASMSLVAILTSTVPARASVIGNASCNNPGQPDRFSCFSIRQSGKAAQSFGFAGAAATGHGGYSPADLQSAYALPASNTTATVAIVDAFDNPSAEADLAVYRAFYHLPPCTTSNGCFRKVNQAGSSSLSSLPSPDAGWSGEIALDLAMVSATCPSCHLLLVEADQASTDLYVAVQTAVRLGAKFVSMSWGSAENGSESALDNAFFNTAGVVYAAASGDSGYGVNYPASSANVIAVGGTTLRPAATQRGWTESAWSSRPGVGTGSGCSATVTKPGWQSSVPTRTCPRRAVTDVSAVADPNTGVAVYQKYGANGWVVYGGTSAAAPIIAGVYALAGEPGAADRPASFPYTHPGALNDVQAGSNGTCGAAALCQAGAGWDGPTGLGTPRGTAAFTGAGAPASVTAGPSGAKPVTVSAPNTGAARPVACKQQALPNGDFRYGSSGWTASRGVIQTRSNVAYSGTTVARLGGVGRASSGSLSRAINVPAGCSVVVSYRLRIDSADTSRVRHDSITLTVNNRAVQVFSNANRGAYAVRMVRLSALGQGRMQLRWVAREDNSTPTAFLIDDVTVNWG